MNFFKFLCAILWIIVAVLVIYLIYFCVKYGVPQLFIEWLEKIDEFANNLLNKG